MHYEVSYRPAAASAIADLSIGDLLRRAAREAPNELALVEGAEDQEKRRRWSNAQLAEEAELGARALSQLFQAKERVAILAPSVPEWTLAQMSAALAGLILVTINPALRPREIRYILDQSECSGVIVADSYRDQDLCSIVEAERSRLPSIRHVIRLADWTSFMHSSKSGQQLPDVRPTDPAMIQYTSGTTGAPKGAMLTHAGIVNAAHFLSERLERIAGDIWLNPLPMFHTGGCVMGTIGSLSSLGTQVIVGNFDPTLVLRLVGEERPTYFLAVPTMMLALLEHPDFGKFDLSSLQVVSSGGSTVAPVLVRRIEEAFGATFNMSYGQTESSSVISMTPLQATDEQKAETLGLPLSHWEFMIADEDGKPAPVGSHGEICCRGIGTMSGYYNMPEATAEAIDGEGWLHTGDLGVMDEQGYTRLVGRTKDMIIRGGENIFPREIEDILVTHPAVLEAAVVGVSDERWGEVPVAFIRPSATDPLDERDLTFFLRERLAPFKIPRTFVAVEAFPTNAVGKIQKFILREQHEAKLK